MKINCRYCTDGKINNYGEEWFVSLPCENPSSIARTAPVIFKTNGLYFMKFEGFRPIKIKGCPVCGRGLEE